MQETVKVDQLKRAVNGLKSSSEFLGFEITNTITESATVEGDEIGWDGLYTATLYSPEHKTVFAFPQVTIYNGEQINTNRIPNGVDPLNYLVFTWSDFDESNDYTQVYKIWVSKSSSFTEGTPTDITVKVSWRSLFENVETTLTFEDMSA